MAAFHRKRRGKHDNHHRHGKGHKHRRAPSGKQVAHSRSNHAFRKKQFYAKMSWTGVALLVLTFLFIFKLGALVIILIPLGVALTGIGLFQFKYYQRRAKYYERQRYGWTKD